MISSNLFGGSKNDIGPYRATRIWNDLVRTFRAGMPVGRKRRQLKVYEDVFVASDAVTWLHEYLQQNLDTGPEISRPQTVLLLQKFQRSGVIQDVRGDKSNADPLEDNGHLFRFTRLSPRKLCGAATRMPFTSRTNLSVTGASEACPQQRPLSEVKRALCSSTAAVNSSTAATTASEPAPLFSGARRWQSEDTIFLKGRPQQQQSLLPGSSAQSAPLAAASAVQPQPCAAVGCWEQCRDGGSSHASSPADGDAWKAATLEHLRKALLLRHCDELPVDSSLIKAADVVQNVQQSQEQLRNCCGATFFHDSGTPPANDSLPGWLAIAMRCLARWPNRAADELPQYPGYEKDVYAMVKDYFESQPEPMVPFRFYDVLTYAWAQTLVAGRGGSGRGQSTAAMSLAITPRCEPLPLPPRRLVSSSSVDSAAVPLVIADAQQTLVADSSCTLFAKLERGPVLRLPTTSSAEEELNGSLYYTPPSALLTDAASLHAGRAECRGGSEGAGTSAVSTFHGRSPLDFYTRQCLARLGVESRICLTDGALMHASKRFRPSPPHSGSMPNLAVGSSAPAGGSQLSAAPIPAAAAAAVGNASRLSEMGSSVPTDYGYGSAESVRSSKPASHECRRTAASMGSQGMVAGTLKKFASVRDLVTNFSLEQMQSNLITTQRCFFSVSDVNSADAFLQSTISGSCLSGSSTNAGQAAARPAGGSLATCIELPAPPVRSQNCSVLQQPWQRQGAGADCCASAGQAAAQRATRLGYQPVLSGAAIRASKQQVAVTAQQFGTDSDAGSAPASITTAAEVNSHAPSMSCNPGTGLAAASSTFTSAGVCAEQPAALNEMMQSRLMRSIQLCLLLLPPTNRRHLQILLRLLHRLSYNSSIRLNDSGDVARPTPGARPLPRQSGKEFVLDSFWRSILRCANEANMDEVVSKRIVSFMLDNHDHVMAVPADLMKSIQSLQVVTTLRTSGEEQVVPPRPPLRPGNADKAATRHPQLPVAVREGQHGQAGAVVRRVLSEPLRNSVKPRPVTYCEQVTKETYEEQRMSVSERALTELLDNLVADTKMTEKEKKKKLKQFQKAYPEIYVARFPTLESQPAYMKEQPKIKQPLLARPLRLLRSLR